METSSICCHAGFQTNDRILPKWPGSQGLLPLLPPRQNDWLHRNQLNIKDVTTVTTVTIRNTPTCDESNAAAVARGRQIPASRFKVVTVVRAVTRLIRQVLTP
jgi:hypothetical protein